MVKESNFEGFSKGEVGDPFSGQDRVGPNPSKNEWL